MREYNYRVSRFAKQKEEKHGFPLTTNRSYATGYTSSASVGAENALTNYELREGFKKAFFS